jgi:ABC-type multidrug transport system fused ATPase/permease subunit
MYRPQAQPQAQPRGREIALPNASDVGTLALSTVTSFARRHKLISGSYLFGLLVMIMMGSGTKLTMEQAKKYDHIMSTIDLNAEFQASQRYYQANQAYQASKGWFTCDSLCMRNKNRMLQHKAVLDDLRKEGNARMSDAKAVAGLFSEVGVLETKDAFWQYFYQGKQFAKRQSMWDAMFIGIRHMGRDESMIEYGLRVLMQVLVNFSMGLLMALVIFIFGLWGIVKSYQPNPIVAVLFFLSAACAAFAFVTTYLMAIYAAAAGGLYGVAKLAETQARLNNGQAQPPRHVHNRPHYE